MRHRRGRKTESSSAQKDREHRAHHDGLMVERGELVGVAGDR
jgi:hypothetical protein